MIFAIQGWSQTDIQVGNGTTYYYDPLPGWFGWNRSAYLYKASEINAGGVINSISFQIQSASSGTNAKLKIYLLESSMTTMPGLTATNWNTLKTGATLVYTNNAFAGSPTGWKTITLDLPFAYSGVDNLIVLVEGEGCTTGGGCSSQCYNHVSTASHWYSRKDSSAPDDNVGSTSYTGEENNRANIKFNISPLGDYCYPPSQLTAINIAQYSADLTWTTDPSGSSYVIQHKPTSSSTWSQEEYSSSSSHSLSGLISNTDYDVRVKSICSSYSNESAWVNINFRTLISCPTPTSLAVPSTGITTTEALVTWSPTINPVNWNEGYLLQYKPNNVSDWNLANSISAIQDTFYLIQGLLPSTGYSIRLKAICEPGVDSSTWTSTVNFVTGCDIISQFPWTEGFESSWTITTTPGNKPAPNCWTVVNKGGTAIDWYGNEYEYWWKRSTTNSHSGSGNAACYTDFGTTDHNDWLVTPQIALTGGERLRFWAMRANNTTDEPDEISVYISDEDTGLDTTGMGQYGNMPNFTQIFTQMLPVGAWQQIEINLSQYSGNRYIAFVRQNTPDGYYLRLDDVEISELPTCNRPTNVVVSSITTTDAEVSWVNGNSADASWWVYYKQSTSTTYDSVLVNSNPYVLTNLLPSSGYNIYVATDCGTQLSEASPIVNFRTLCDEISALPWSDNFDTYGTASGTFPPCWTRPVINSGNPKIVTANHSAPASLFFQSLTTVPTYAVTPAFTADLNTLMVSFWLKAEGVGSSQSGTITVGVMSDPNDTTTFESVRQISPNSTDWIEYRIMLAGIQLQGSGNYIAFKHNSNASNWYYWLDDVEVDEIPACPNVYGLTAEPASTSSVSVNWDNSFDDGTGFNVAYASNVVGTFDPATSMIIPIPSGTTLPYTIPGFNPGDSIWVAVQRGCLGNWSEAQKINLPEFANQLPFYANFENSLEDEIWTIANGTQTNKWYIGVPGANDSDPTDGIDERGLYISSDNGATATYSSASSSIVFVSTLVEFDNSPAFELSFDWANNGEIDWHDLNVYLMPLSIALTPGTLPNSQYQINTASLAEETSFHTFTRVFDGSYSNSVKQLVFAWQNDDYGNYNPPARVDNISLVALTCGMPYGLAMDSASYNGTDVYLHWTESQGATDWIVEYQQTGTTAWQQVAANSNPFTLTGLNPGTAYQARVRTICDGSDTSSASNLISFLTECITMTVPTPVEPFFAVPPSICWSKMSGLLPATGNATLSTTTSGWLLNSNVTPNNAKINLYGTSCKYWLVSPSIDLGDGTSPAQLEFDVFFTDYGNADHAGTSGTDDRFAVVISTDNGLTWNAANAIIWSNEATATRVLNNIPNTPTHIIIPLNDPTTTLPYTGNIKIGFYGESTVSNADNDMHIDNFEVRPYSTCQRPTGLIATNVTSTDATIHFTENGTSTTWQYVLTDGTITDPNNGTPVSTTDNPIQLTGLTPQTEYTIWIRSDCTTETSIWSTPLTFVTEAPPATVPYSFDFENQTEALAWRNLSGSVNNWAIGQAAGNGPSTQNTTDNTAAYISNNNGVSYAMTDGYIYAYGYRDIDFGATPASYSLNFDWKCQGYVYNNSASSGLIVYLRDITDTLNPTGYPSNVNDNLGLFAEQSTWQTEQLPLDNVSGVKRLIFFYFDNYENNMPPAAIDNISIVLETCPRPFDVAVSGATTTTAQVSWNHPGATDFIVSYRTNTTGSTLIDIPATSSPITIQGLTSGTAYLLAVRAICNGDTTIYSETVQFTTPCVDGAISSFPWIEGFENGISCWIINSSVSSADWTIETSGSWPTATPHSGSNMIMFNSNSISSGGWSTLYSPLLDFPNDQYQISFWLFRDSADYLTNADRVELYVNSTASETGAALLGTVNRSYSLAPIETSGGWYQYTFNLPAGMTGNNYVILKGISAYGRNIYVDDLAVESIGIPCNPPTNLAVSNIQNTTATVSWIPAGTESAWQVRLGTTGTPDNVSSTTYTFPATLTPGTAYTYYVRANCGTNYSAWVQGTFTTTQGHQAIQVTTTAPTAITQTNATFQGTYIQGTEVPTAIGFEYKTTAATTWTDQAVTPVATPFTYQVTPLIANTNYEVRAYAVTPTDGRVYGATLSFATPAIVPPTVTTLTTTGITQTNATFNGTIVQGSEEINARGFEYKLPSQAWPDANIISATGTNNITASVTNLQHSTTYEVRAYARTASMNNYYGTTLTFTTQTPGVTPPTLVTNEASSINDRGATLNGKVTAGSETITNQGFEWKATSASTWTPVTVVPVNDTITYQLTGIEPSTLYEFKTFATTASGTGYGTTKTFQTLGLNTIDGSVITVMMYPNPASQETKLVVTGLQGEVKITISDVQGRIINTINTKANNNKVEETINVSNMANGVYYVRLQNDQISRTQKLIVK